MKSRANFVELYCQKRDISPDRFVEEVLAQTLYPHAHILYVLLIWLHRDYGAADFDFINGVGRLSRLQDFWVEAEEFAHHPRNFGLLRQRLRIRVSARRLRRLMKRTLHATIPEPAWSSTVPWSSPESASIEKVDVGAH
ncbi:MAG TPA: hypothetical protein VMC06_05000 [Opitutaceae bacterium]|nr:hypothetical protein [Opitutaceae bacterium]